MSQFVQIIKEKFVGFIPENAEVKYTLMGNHIEIMYMEKVSGGFGIRRIDKDFYENLNTGVICEYNHSEKRIENLDNIRKTLKYLRALINTNFCGLPSEKFFTITYKENMTDPVRLKNDCVKFFKRLRYKYPDFDYLSIVEPQGRGAWHCHILIRFNDIDEIWVSSPDIEKMWGNGTARVKAIKSNVDNLGAYLSAYLGDIEYNQENLKMLKKSGKDVNDFKIKVAETDGAKKKFIKGGRLYLYPTGMRIYRKSKGIIEPEIKYGMYRDREKIVGSCEPNYKENIKILNYKKEVINYISYEQYNKNKV
jgi:hypothetical protein